jgi:2-polyprenyl-3-methyl-5-hydroxy-6-metoxy-1,4-benzoquinol methylase
MRDIPAEQELAEFYDTSESELWNSGAFSVLNDYKNNREMLQRYYHRERTKYLDQIFPEKMKNSKTKVLDIGCGSGVFLATLRDRGLKVQGQDLSPQSVSLGRETLEIDLTSQPLQDCNFPHLFNLITCYDVIEHWSDPRLLVMTIRKLATKGAGIVIRTPNHESWLRLLTGKKWLWYIPPAHIHYFTPASLKSLLEQEGFRIRRIRTGASTYLFFLAYYFLQKQTSVGSGNTFLDMRRWKEILVFGLDNLVRVAASPILIPARLANADAVLEIYATPV